MCILGFRSLLPHIGFSLKEDKCRPMLLGQTFLNDYSNLGACNFQKRHRREAATAHQVAQFLNRHK